MKELRKKKRKEHPLLLQKKCPNCGGNGPHFVPPSCGDEGFFICDKPRKERREKKEGEK